MQQPTITSMTTLGIVLAALLTMPYNLVAAEKESINIPLSDNPPIIDGKWTTSDEWSSASETRVVDDKTGYSAVIRTMHDRSNLYFLIDFLDDETTVFPPIFDSIVICIDSKADGGSVFGTDDYCFHGNVEQNEFESKVYFSRMFRSQLKGTGQEMTHVQSVHEGMSGFTGDNNPYTTKPHRTYEMVIPVEVLGANDHYGLLVFISERSKFFVHWPATPDVIVEKVSWPSGDARCKSFIPLFIDLDENVKHYICLPPPSVWGQLVSPDQSIPEFPLPIIVLASILTATIIIARRNVAHFVLKE